MSCVTFLSTAQRAALRDADDERLTPEEIRAAHPSPPVTDGALRRIRGLARSTDPAIRQSAALNQRCPVDVLEHLARDPEAGVRQCVARQPRTPESLLRSLAQDPSADVRGWVAAHPNVPEALLDRLATDDDATVRGVVGWARNWTRSEAH